MVEAVQHLALGQDLSDGERLTVDREPAVNSRVRGIPSEVALSADDGMQRECGEL